MTVTGFSSTPLPHPFGTDFGLVVMNFWISNFMFWALDNNLRK